MQLIWAQGDKTYKNRVEVFLVLLLNQGTNGLFYNIMFLL